MKLGILTFHSQQNYGGVLQCWALQTVLSNLGHEVYVIDRWLDARNHALRGVRASRSIKEWVSFVLRFLTLQGGLCSLMRSVRFERFIKQNLIRTPYHFCNWFDAPQNLGVDKIVVGSDQVWHGGDWGRPDVYLLEGAVRLPAISYAASFGMRKIPAQLKSIYTTGLARFSFISVREIEGKSLVESLGYSANIVADPTLLVSSDVWKRLIDYDTEIKRRKLTVYFIGEERIESLMPRLRAFAVKNGYDVDVFTEGYHRKFTFNPVAIIRNIKNLVPSRVKLNEGAGPVDFLRSIYSSEYVVTNSFHAVMFSYIFSKKVQVVAPRSEYRSNMFSRIQEFVSQYVNGDAIVPDIASALSAVESSVEISFDALGVKALRKKSLQWLKHSL